MYLIEPLCRTTHLTSHSQEQDVQDYILACSYKVDSEGVCLYCSSKNRVLGRVPQQPAD